MLLDERLDLLLTLRDLLLLHSDPVEYDFFVRVDAIIFLDLIDEPMKVWIVWLLIEV